MAVIIGEFIECRVCGKPFKVISNTHTRFKHNITMEQYKSKFPGAPIESAVAKSVNNAVRKSNANTVTALRVRSRTGKNNKGKIRSVDFKETRSKKYAGDGNPFYNKTHSLETRKKLSAHFQGVDIEEWEDFSNDEHKRAWKSKRAKRWSQDIFKRDNYTCGLCGKRGGDLEAHHIIRRADAPDLTYNLNNGITLCVPCHKETFGKEANYAEGLRAMVDKKLSKSLK